MIIQNPTNINLALGADKTTIGAEDGTTTIPPTIQVVIESIKTGSYVQGPGLVTSDSCLVSVYSSRTNQGYTIQNIVTLNPGLWDVVTNLGSNSNYQHTYGIGTWDVAIVLFDASQNTGNPLHGNYAENGQAQFSSSGRFKLLLRNPLLIRLDTTALGAAQILDIAASVLANRIL